MRQTNSFYVRRVLDLPFTDELFKDKPLFKHKRRLKAAGVEALREVSGGVSYWITDNKKWAAQVAVYKAKERLLR